MFIRNIRNTFKLYIDDALVYDVLGQKDTENIEISL